MMNDDVCFVLHSVSALPGCRASILLSDGALAWAFTKRGVSLCQIIRIQVGIAVDQAEVCTVKGLDFRHLSCHHTHNVCAFLGQPQRPSMILPVNDPHTRRHSRGKLDDCAMTRQGLIAFSPHARRFLLCGKSGLLLLAALIQL